MNFVNNMRFNVFMLSFVAILICFSFHSAEAWSRNVDHDWDILIFTQQWPMTECKEVEKHSHSCNMPAKRDSWSVHGVWPTKLGTIGPGFCNRTWLFDPEQVRPIESQLMQSWINIDGGSSHYSFWAHEWSKHGTCAAVLESLNSEFKYFSKGLEWLDKFSMTNILAEENILPSNTNGYKVLDIHNAIIGKLRVNPAIECRKEDGVSMIVEIRICFDKDLNLHDCDGIKEHKMIGGQAVITNCDPTQDVMYPHSTEGSIIVQLFKLIGFIKWLTL